MSYRPLSEDNLRYILEPLDPLTCSSKEGLQELCRRAGLACTGDKDTLRGRIKAYAKSRLDAKEESFAVIDSTTSYIDQPERNVNTANSLGSRFAASIKSIASLTRLNSTDSLYETQLAEQNTHLETLQNEPWANHFNESEEELAISTVEPTESPPVRGRIRVVSNNHQLFPVTPGVLAPLSPETCKKKASIIFGSPIASSTPAIENYQPFVFGSAGDMKDREQSARQFADAGNWAMQEMNKRINSQQSERSPPPKLSRGASFSKLFGGFNLQQPAKSELPSARYDQEHKAQFEKYVRSSH